MNSHPTVFEEARALIEEAGKIVITNHMNPDGDAIGSALGLYPVLKKLGKEVRVIVPNDYPDFLKWINAAGEVLVYEQGKKQADLVLGQADLIIHLDYNALKRSGCMKDALTASSAKKVVIDHHQMPEDFADVLYSDAGMSSTCEMVYHFLEETGLVDLLDRGAAESLYTGLITDTGNFRYSATTPDTHRVAAKLLGLGVESNVVSSRIYDSNRPGRLKLLSRALDRMEILREYATAIIYLTEEDMEELYYQKGDTEGFVNYGLSVQDVELSAFIYPRDGKVKMSFRSKTDFDVNDFARAHFSGGGHLNAAGGVSHLSLKETIEEIKKVLPAYARKLPNI